MWIYAFPTVEPDITVGRSIGGNAGHNFTIELAKDYRVFLTQDEMQLLSVQINAALYEAYTTTEDDES